MPIARLRHGLFAFLLIIVSGCGSTALAPSASSPVVATAVSQAATSLPTPAATETPLPTVTPLATATATATPEPTATSEPTATPEPTAVPIQAFDEALAERLQRILDDTVADGAIPGAVLSVQIPGHEAWSGASGYANRTLGTPMEPDTRVRIASISKVFTAIVVLQLIEEEKLSLSDPLSTWFPDLVPNSDQITVHNLLNHTTGLYDYVEDRSFINLGYQNPKRVWAPHEMVDYAVQFAPAFAPGAPGQWDYSSTNYVILGMIVEQVTGKTLAQETRARIFEPVGMQNTFFSPDEPVQGEYAHGYRFDVDQSAISLSIVFGTANIVSTVGDVRDFGQAIQNGKLLTPEGQDMLYSFENAHGQYNMPHLYYGNGIMLNRFEVSADVNGKPFSAEETTVIGHIGGFGGFRSALWTAPASGITIALGENQGATDPNILASRVFAAILQHERIDG